MHLFLGVGSPTTLAHAVINHDVIHARHVHVHNPQWPPPLAASVRLFWRAVFTAAMTSELPGCIVQPDWSLPELTQAGSRDTI